MEKWVDCVEQIKQQLYPPTEMACAKPIIFDKKMQEKHKSSQKWSAHQSTHECRASQITSCTEGTTPSQPLGARSRRDKAKDFAAAQPNSFCPRLSHDRPGPKRVDRGIPQFHRTIDLRGQHDETRPIPFSRQAQGTCALCVCGPSPRIPRLAAPRQALPSKCKGDTIVESMADWDPPKRGSPSATTSSRLPLAPPSLRSSSI